MIDKEQQKEEPKENINKITGMIVSNINRPESYFAAMLIVMITITILLSMLKRRMMILKAPIPPQYIPVYEWITKYRAMGVSKERLRNKLEERGWDLNKINYMIR